MKKIKPTTVLKVGDIVHISTSIEVRKTGNRKILQTFGRIESIHKDMCSISLINKSEGRWRITENDIQYTLCTLREYPNKQLIEIIRDDLLSECNADIVGRWLSKV